MAPEAKQERNTTLVPPSGRVPSRKARSSRLEKQARLAVVEQLLVAFGQDGIDGEMLVKLAADELKVAFTTLKNMLNAGQYRTDLEERYPGYHLRIEQNSKVYFEARDPALKKTREAQSPHLKRLLANAVWDYLYGLKTEGVSARVLGGDELKSRIVALRQKSLSNIFIDAGSTTEKIVDVLLSGRTFPLVVSPSADLTDDRHRGSGLVSPRFITNSPSVVARISDSTARRSVQEPILVGGQVRLERDSVCGTLAEACLPHWAIRGDVAIVGTTGYTETAAGGTFASDDVDEANLKGLFLDRARIKMVVLDSTKLNSPLQSFKPFALLSSQSVDVVVVDDGAKLDMKSQVETFTEAGLKAGVAVVIASSTSPHRRR